MCLTSSKQLVLGLLICLVSTVASSSEASLNQTNIQWQAWKPQVFTRAQQQKRLVLLDLTAKWCQYCRKMDNVTYRDQAVSDIINQNYLAVRADEADYPRLYNRYKKEGLPLTVIFDSNGNELMKRSGYMKPQWMVWMLMAVAAQDPEANIKK